MDVEQIKFNSKEILYYKMINRYFKNLRTEKINIMLNIVNGKSNISLRLLDWFVTRYAKRHKICYKICDEYFNVHISYKAQLKSFKKRYFDPFRRREKFKYNYNKLCQDNTIQTTIGQLNFFRWTFTNKIIDYVTKNYNKISKAMILSNRHDKKKKLELQKLKETESEEEKKVKFKKNGVKVKAKKKKPIDNKTKLILSFDY